MTATVCCRMFPLNVPRRFLRQTSTLRRCFRLVWIKIIVSTLGKKSRYQQLSCTPMSSVSPTTGDSQSEPSAATLSTSSDHTMDSSDIVTLKISLLGDSHIGKTSFLAKYAGMERRGGGLDGAGLNQIDKTLCVGGAARIAYTIWNLKGDGTSHIQIPTTCKDSVAMLFMFDLTSRCTLNRIIKWYQEARKWNQTAIPVLIGTKFDEFVQLPIDLQWTIANQARTYAKAMNASLFFSSATYNINVNKVFKFITAKLFNLPWTLERNLTVGEPIIDF